MLQLTWLSVVPLLPSQLADEAVSQPDQDDSCKGHIAQVDFVHEHVTAPVVAVHQCPRGVDHFAFNDLAHKLADFLSKRQQLLVKSCHRIFTDWHHFRGLLGGKSTWDLIILATVVMPPVLFALKDDKIDGLDGSLTTLLDPFKGEL